MSFSALTPQECSSPYALSIQDTAGSDGRSWKTKFRLAGLELIGDTRIKSIICWFVMIAILLRSMTFMFPFQSAAMDSFSKTWITYLNRSQGPAVFQKLIIKGNTDGSVKPLLLLEIIYSCWVMLLGGRKSRGRG